MKAEIESCLICGSRKLRVKVGYEKDHLVTCQSCSFVFSNLRPSQQELDTVYGGYSRDVGRTDATLRKMQETAVYLKNQSNAGRLIDIGCGDGEFLSLFRNLGCEVYGTEYDSRTEEICRNKGITMLRGGVMPVIGESNSPGYFDLAIFAEVIEHINNPLDVIENISRLLRKGGLLYITTPNFASLERRVLGPQWGMIAYPEHISFYSPRTIDRLLTKCGYERHSLRTENISVFRIIQFLNRRKTDTGTTAQLDPEKVAASAQSAVQKSTLLMIAKRAINAALNATGTGTSLVAVYRRK